MRQATVVSKWGLTERSFEGDEAGVLVLALVL